jgi:hypothetical protein
MPSNREMPIPKSRAGAVSQFVVTLLVLAFVLLAILNLCNGVGIVASSIGLVFIAMMIGSAATEEGGLRRFLINRLGELFGKLFVVSHFSDAEPGAIRFGFRLLGHRFIQQTIPVGRIESVEWNTGQATARAGHDMNDWHVVVWFDHNDPRKSEKRGNWPKPDQDLHIVGPSSQKERAEELGLSLVAFLRDAGADLIQGTTANCFVRRVTQT